ncbi:MAG: hypothetical protein JJU02_02715 [Cryomorphaceae bacterium]|nr:hypothetical protein [Cryomorphaceae bacterium]
MRITASILLLALILPFGWKVGLLTKYVVHYEQYLAACENKDKLDMKCNGTCKFSQELNALEKQESHAPQLPELVKVEIHPFIVSTFSLIHLFDFHLKVQIQTPLKLNISNGFLEVATPPPNLV